jgi:hypothetical protein
LAGLQARLQECANPFDRPLARLSPVTQVEHETRIAHDLAPESSGRHAAVPKKIFYLSKKMHCFLSPSFGDSAISSFPMHFLLV